MHSVRAAKPSPTYSKTCNGVSTIIHNKHENFMKFDNKNVNDVALIRHLATSNIANFMWYNFLLVKK